MEKKENKSNYKSGIPMNDEQIKEHLKVFEDIEEAIKELYAD